MYFKPSQLCLAMSWSQTNENRWDLNLGLEMSYLLMCYAQALALLVRTWGFRQMFPSGIIVPEYHLGYMNGSKELMDSNDAKCCTQLSPLESFTRIFDPDAVVLKGFLSPLAYPSCLPACLSHCYVFLLHLSGNWDLFQPLLQTVSNFTWFQWKLICDFRFENPTQNYFRADMSLKRASKWLFISYFQTTGNCFVSQQNLTHPQHVFEILPKCVWKHCVHDRVLRDQLSCRCGLHLGSCSLP